MEDTLTEGNTFIHALLGDCKPRIPLLRASNISMPLQKQQNTDRSSSSLFSHPKPKGCCPQHLGILLATKQLSVFAVIEQKAPKYNDI